MVAVVTGANLGLSRSSLAFLGGQGELGSAAVGQTGENVIVDASSGNLVITDTDDILTGVGPQDVTARTYNSDATSDGDNDDNWQMGGYTKLNDASSFGGAITLTGSDGSQIVYNEVSAGYYTNADGPGPYNSLAYFSGTSTWVLTDGATQATETFNTSGQLIQSADTSGNTLTYAYTSGYLTSVTSSNGDYEAYDYSGDLLQKVVAHYTDPTSGASTSTATYYGYDGSNRLETVTTDLSPDDNSTSDSDVYTTTYTYDGSSNRVASIVQSDGSGLAITYDGSDRVSTVTQTLLTGVASQTTTFTYNSSTETTVTDAYSNNTVLTFDATTGKLASITDPLSQTTSFTYGGDGRVSLVTDPLGDNHYYFYDGSGNPNWLENSDGEVVTSTYGSKNELLSQTTYTIADGDSGVGDPQTTYYVYDDDDRLAFTISAVGDVTQNVYNDDGTVASVIQYTAAIYTPTSPPALSDMTSWASGMTDPQDAERTDYTYNYRGNLATSTTYGALQSSGLSVGQGDPTTAQTTTYVYNERGQLLSSLRGGDTAATTYTYDGLGRQLTMTDPDGNVTTTAYANTGSGYTQTITAANGQVTTNVYMNAGWLMYSQTSGTGLTTADTDVGEDYLGRVTSTTDADGNRSYSTYDAAGDKTADIDATGAMTQYFYDADSRVVATVTYATKIDLTAIYTGTQTYADELYAGAVTAADVQPSASSNDQWNWTVYDYAGHVTATVDGLGDVTTYAYDGAGNQVSTTRMATALDTSGLESSPTGTITLPSISDDDLTTRTFYDADGRVIGTLDPTGALTGYRYDGAGNKIDTLNFPTLVTDPTLLASGNFTDLVVAASNVGTDVTDNPDNPWGWATWGLSESWVPDIDGHTAVEFTNTAGPGEGNQGITNAWPSLSTGDYETYSVSLMGGTAYSATVGIYSASTGYGSGSDGSYAEILSGPGQLTQISPGLYYVTGLSSTVATRVEVVRQATTSETYQPTVSVGGDDSSIGDSIVAFDAYTTTTAGAPPPATLHNRDVYNAAGELAATIDGAGDITTYSYDADGRVSGATAGITSDPNQWAYGVLSAASMPSPSGMVTKTTNYTYDNEDRVIQVTGDDFTNSEDWSTTTPTTTNVYDDVGNLIETTDTEGNHSFYQYDELGRKIGEVDAAGDVTTWAYDAAGNVTSETAYATPLTSGEMPTSPASATATITVAAAIASVTASSTTDRTTTFAYDADNRLLTSTVSGIEVGAYDTGTSSYDYGSTDLTTTNTYDAFGNIVKVTDADGNETYAYYDDDNRQIATIDGDGYMTYKTYDAQGRLTQVTAFATAVSGVSISSDPASLISGLSVAGADRVTDYTYDDDGRVLTQSTEEMTSYTVNATTGALSSPTTGDSTVAYTYNAFGEMSSMTQATDDTTLYGYDGAGRVVNTTGPAFTDYTATSVHQAVLNTYNGLGEVTSTTVQAASGTDPTHDEITDYSYANGGMLTSKTDADGDATYYYYDKDGRVNLTTDTRATWDDSTGAATTDTDYYYTTYDALGQVSGQAIDWEHDSSWYGDYTSTSYNAFGQVATTGENGTDQKTYAYDQAGRLYAAVNDGMVSLYVYDGDGDKTLTVTSTGGTIGTYDIPTILSTGVAAGTSADLVGAIGVFDARGEQTETLMPQRQLSASDTEDLTSSQTFDAFGEVRSSTDTLGDETDYHYNTLGEVTEVDAPSITVMTSEGGTTTASPTTYDFYDISGRQVGTEDANGNETTRLLLAGTGYGGTQAKVTTLFLPGSDGLPQDDGTYTTTAYDVYGNDRVDTDGLGKVTTNEYDQMGNLIEVDHPVRAAYGAGNPSSSAVQLVDHYEYDSRGQRIGTWNNELSSSDVQKTNYDGEGRITDTWDFMGHQTTTTYAWWGGMATTGLGTYGGFVETTTLPTHTGDLDDASFSKIDDVDVAGLVVQEQDYGGHLTDYGYDANGRLVSETDDGSASTPSGVDITTSYFNTGRTAETDNNSTSDIEIAADSFTTYAYDKMGRTTNETQVQGTTLGFPLTDMDTTTTYDALGWVTEVQDGTAVEIDYEYDLNGNVLQTDASYPSSFGVPTNEYQYTYDQMNRVTSDEVGTVSGGVFTETNETTLTYDADGQRESSSAYDATTSDTTEDDYTYTADGYLATDTQSVDSTPVSEASDVRDAEGNLIFEVDDDITDSTNAVTETAYNANSQMIDQADGAAGTTTVFTYNADGLQTEQAQFFSTTAPSTSDPLPTAASFTTGGLFVPTYPGSPNETVTTDYGWYDVGEQSLVTTNNVSFTSGAETQTYTYGPTGELVMEETANDAYPIQIFYMNSAEGQVRAQDAANIATSASLYTIGRMTGADGLSAVTNTYDGEGRLAGQVGQDKTPGFYITTPYENFDRSGNNLTAAPNPTYTVKTGDTLTGIAQALWGDGSLWYIIADANGLTAANQAQAGEILTIPGKVVNVHNTSSAGDNLPAHGVFDGLTTLSPEYYAELELQEAQASPDYNAYNSFSDDAGALLGTMGPGYSSPFLLDPNWATELEQGDPDALSAAAENSTPDAAQALENLVAVESQVANAAQDGEGQTDADGAISVDGDGNLVVPGGVSGYQLAGSEGYSSTAVEGSAVSVDGDGNLVVPGGVSGYQLAGSEGDDGGGSGSGDETLALPGVPTPLPLGPPSNVAQTFIANQSGDTLFREFKANVQTGLDLMSENDPEYNTIAADNTALTTTLANGMITNATLALGQTGAAAPDDNVQISLSHIADYVDQNASGLLALNSEDNDSADAQTADLQQMVLYLGAGEEIHEQNHENEMAIKWGGNPPPTVADEFQSEIDAYTAEQAYYASVKFSNGLWWAGANAEELRDAVVNQATVSRNMWLAQQPTE